VAADCCGGGEQDGQRGDLVELRVGVPCHLRPLTWEHACLLGGRRATVVVLLWLPSRREEEDEEVIGIVSEVHSSIDVRFG
jgi:hypothetical protein